jgi:hypothetical protein
MTQQEHFEAMRARWRKASEKARELRWNIEGKYGTWYIYAPAGQRAKIERANAAEEKAQEAIFAWLDAHSPRDWRHGVPCHWVCDQLTYEDAMTRERLSVQTPCSYGSMPSDALRFAAAVSA